MSINYTIRADVIDITKDTPKQDDVFLVDTNVWYWITYTKASQCTNPPALYQTNHYPGYLNKALQSGAKIYKSGLTLAELTHLIEKAEREIFEKTNGLIRPKEFRHNQTSERNNVVAEIISAWGQVTSMADPLTINIKSTTTSAAITRLHTQQVDGYDLFILQSMQNHGVVKVITDDGDFASVPGIKVFIANHNVITAAQQQGKLKTR